MSRLPLVLRPLVPLVSAWVRHAARSGAERRPASSFGHTSLAPFYSAARLASTQVVVTEHLPTPMLPTLGMQTLRSFVQGRYAAITLLDTFFVRPDRVGDAALFFHELVHVVQWEHLGLPGFIDRYGASLVIGGYDGCSLERQAYDHEARFAAGAKPFDIEATIRAELDADRY